MIYVLVICIKQNMPLAKQPHLCSFTHHPLIIQTKYSILNNSRSLSKCQFYQSYWAIIQEPLYHFFPYHFNFLKRWILTGRRMKFASKLLSCLSVKEHYYLMIPHYLDLSVSGKSLKTSAVLFSLWFCILCISMPRRNAQLLIFKSINTSQLSISFLLKLSCPVQQSDPLVVRQLPFCSDWKWIHSNASNVWHFQKKNRKSNICAIMKSSTCIWLIKKKKKISIAPEDKR